MRTVICSSFDENFVAAECRNQVGATTAPQNLGLHAMTR
jgi:hypothetical protein